MMDLWRQTSSADAYQIAIFTLAENSKPIGWTAMGGGRSANVIDRGVGKPKGWAFEKVEKRC